MARPLPPDRREGSGFCLAECRGFCARSVLAMPPPVLQAPGTGSQPALRSFEQTQNRTPDPGENWSDSWASPPESLLKNPQLIGLPSFRLGKNAVPTG